MVVTGKKKKFKPLSVKCQALSNYAFRIIKPDFTMKLKLGLDTPSFLMEQLMAI
jgi:hypothetical protein